MTKLDIEVTVGINPGMIIGLDIGVDDYNDMKLV